MTKPKRWTQFIEQEQRKPYYQDIINEVYDKGYLADKPIYPAYDNVFRAFAVTPLNHVRLVILGQDPYPNKNANGLAFGTGGVRQLPPSLRNIYKELERSYPDRDFDTMQGELTGWAKQGILLLNTSLTIEEGRSHEELWRPFILEVIRALRGSTFLLLGKKAQKLFRDAGGEGDVVAAPHPSPLTRGFVGSNCFIETERLVGKILWERTESESQERLLNIDPFYRRLDEPSKSDIHRRGNGELNSLNTEDCNLFIYS